ncbi:MAG: AbrB/MazE/SpoVT family DNA-binding domain-containing protein [Thermodesulfovibrionales bacterium]|nr:AbrB/MazE/SpoVT family DNA-binding domain-containing protein [Thermodesulfovibrionales bacterium]
MPVATITSKGQLTIPKDIRDVLHLRQNDKVAIVVEDGVAVIRPIKGNILDIGASIKISAKEKPIDFKKARKETIRRIAGHTAGEGR